MIEKPIVGSGGGGGKGGGGGGGTPTEDPDTLQSTQYARVLDLISEGEIDGIEGGQKGVFLDGTAVQSSSGDKNFTGYSFDTRNGTQDQTYIPDSLGPSLKKQLASKCSSQRQSPEQLVILMLIESE